MRECANIQSYIRRPLVIFDFSTAPFWISLYMRKIQFSFLSVQVRSCLYFTFKGWHIYVYSIRAIVRLCGVPYRVESTSPSTSAYPLLTLAHSHPSTVGQLITHSTILIILVTPEEDKHWHWHLPSTIISSKGSCNPFLEHPLRQ